MTSLLIFAAVAAAASWAASRLRVPTMIPKARWWPVVALSPDIDPAAVAYALGQIRKGRRGSVSVLRVGTGGGDADVWIGITGAADPGRAAAEIAAAGGGETGPEGDPPAMSATAYRWYYSSCWSSPHHEGFGDPRIHDHVRPVDGTRFADLVNSRLEADDVLLLSARPTRSGETMHAAALSTDEAAAAAWNDVPPPQRPIRPAPHPAALLAVVSAAAALIPAARWLITAQAAWTIVAAAACFAAALYALRACYIASPVVHRAVEGRAIKVPRRAPLLTRLRDRGSVAPEPAKLAVGLLAAWIGGGSRTAVVASARRAPAALLEEAAVPIGRDPAGRQCFITDTDRQWGLFAVGDPGMGKTNWLLSVAAADAAAIAGGARRSLVWIETKGEGARKAADVLRANGVDPVVVTVAEPDGPRLELIDWHNPERSAHTLTEAMKYAYGKGEIFESSAEVFNAVFKAAIDAAADREALDRLGYTGLPNVMELAFWMIGGDPENSRQAQAETALSHRESYDAVSRYTSHLSKYKSENVLEAPKNKLSGQMFAKGLWDAGTRKTVTFRTILQDHHALVVNLGPVPGGDGYTDLTARRCASMMLYMLWDEISLSCDAWQSQGRSVAVYSDELHDLVGGGGDIEVVGAMAAQGRSRGVLPVFATQWPLQLTEEARLGVLSFGSRVYFRVDNVDVAEEAARDLLDAYPSAELRTLPVGQCAARLRRDGVAQAAFTLHPPLM